MAVTESDVAAWLAEDVGDGDLTSLAVVDEAATCEAARPASSVRML